MNPRLTNPAAPLCSRVSFYKLPNPFLHLSDFNWFLQAAIKSTFISTNKKGKKRAAAVTGASSRIGISQGRLIQLFIRLSAR